MYLLILMLSGDSTYVLPPSEWIRMTRIVEFGRRTVGTVTKRVKNLCFGPP